jgi:hypothetical protein
VTQSSKPALAEQLAGLRARLDRVAERVEGLREATRASYSNLTHGLQPEAAVRRDVDVLTRAVVQLDVASLPHLVDDGEVHTLDRLLVDAEHGLECTLNAHGADRPTGCTSACACGIWTAELRQVQALRRWLASFDDARRQAREVPGQDAETPKTKID